MEVEGAPIRWEYQVVKSSNLFLLAVWFWVWGVIVLNDVAKSGFWVPVPDPRTPALLFLSLFFYGPPLLVFAREVIERRAGEQETGTTRVFSIAAKSFAVVLGFCALVMAVYAVATI